MAQHPHLNSLPIAAPPTSMFSSTAGSKRKRDPPQKFYAVRIGRQPGIFYSWPDCLAQVKGHANATFKSFKSLSEAQRYLHNDASPQSNGGRWYAVRAGRVPGVYTDYQDVLDQVTGWKNARHKVFSSKAEAERYIAEVGDDEGDAGSGQEPATKKAKAAKGSRRGVPGMVKEEGASPSPAVGSGGGGVGVTASMTTGEYEAGEAPLPEDAVDGFDTSIVLDTVHNGARYRTRTEREAVRYTAARPVPTAAVRIYTDGSALGNGRAGALAGVGVYFGPGDGRNVSEPLTGSKQTNQRAELTAVVRALELAPRDRRVTVVTDSQYAIKCVTEWSATWRRNGWLNSSRKPVENRDLVQKILDLLDERVRLNRHRQAAAEEETTAETGRARSVVSGDPWACGPAAVTFEWVKGHDKDVGNNAADQLAVAGSRMAQELNAAEFVDDV